MLLEKIDRDLRGTRSCEVANLSNLDLRRTRPDRREVARRNGQRRFPARELSRCERTEDCHSILLAAFADRTSTSSSQNQPARLRRVQLSEMSPPGSTTANKSTGFHGLTDSPVTEIDALALCRSDAVTVDPIADAGSTTA